MYGISMQSELGALEEAAQTDPPALSALILQPLQIPQTASLFHLLQRLSVQYRVNQLIQRVFRSLKRMRDSKDLKLIEEKVLSLLQILSQQNKELSSVFASVPPDKSICLLQLLSFPARKSVWPVPLSISNPDFISNSPVTHFFHRLDETYFSKSEETPLEFPAFLVDCLKLLIASDFQFLCTSCRTFAV